MNIAIYILNSTIGGVYSPIMQEKSKKYKKYYLSFAQILYIIAEL